MLKILRQESQQTDEGTHVDDHGGAKREAYPPQKQKNDESSVVVQSNVITVSAVSNFTIAEKAEKKL